MRSFQIVFRSLLVVTLLFITGCYGGGTARMYDGDPLPKNRVAFIQSSQKAGTSIDKIDGKSIGFNAQAEVLPGNHTVDVSQSYLAYARTVRRNIKKRIIITAEPGHTYLIWANPILGKSAEFNVMDKPHQ